MNTIKVLKDKIDFNVIDKNELKASFQLYSIMMDTPPGFNFLSCPEIENNKFELIVHDRFCNISEKILKATLPILYLRQFGKNCCDCHGFIYFLFTGELPNNYPTDEFPRSCLTFRYSIQENEIKFGDFVTFYSTKKYNNEYNSHSAIFIGKDSFNNNLYFGKLGYNGSFFAMTRKDIELYLNYTENPVIIEKIDKMLLSNDEYISLNINNINEKWFNIKIVEKKFNEREKIRNDNSHIKKEIINHHKNYYKEINFKIINWNANYWKGINLIRISKNKINLNVLMGKSKIIQIETYDIQILQKNYNGTIIGYKTLSEELENNYCELYVNNYKCEISQNFLKAIFPFTYFYFNDKSKKYRQFLDSYSFFYYLYTGKIPELDQNNSYNFEYIFKSINENEIILNDIILFQSMESIDDQFNFHISIYIGKDENGNNLYLGKIGKIGPFYAFTIDNIKLYLNGRIDKEVFIEKILYIKDKNLNNIDINFDNINPEWFKLNIIKKITKTFIFQK
jgi:cell wall-associated NlpC family hydrolase